MSHDESRYQHTLQLHVCLLLSWQTSSSEQNVSQGPICFHIFKRFHSKTQPAGNTCCLTKSQYTDTWSAGPGAAAADDDDDDDDEGGGGGVGGGGGGEGEVVVIVAVIGVVVVVVGFISNLIKMF